MSYHGKDVDGVSKQRTNRCGEQETEEDRVIVQAHHKSSACQEKK